MGDPESGSGWNKKNMKKIIILLGIPGSGKGTQAKMIYDAYNYGHISTGDLLRAIDADPDAAPEHKELLASMKAGKLVSDDFIYQIAFAEIEKYLNQGKGVVLDGAIRTEAQAERYQTFFAEQGVDDSVITIEIALDDDTATARIMGRARNSGGAREDDTPEHIARRMEQQGNGAIAPIREYYREQGVLAVVDGSMDISEVKDAITDVLENK